MQLKFTNRNMLFQKNYLLGEYFIKKEYYEDKMKGFTVTAGDIIISCAGTIGESYILRIAFGQVLLIKH